MLLIDKFSSKPVYEQLVEGIKRDILIGTFVEGAQLPSVRELSALLAVNPNTIQKSYAELMRQGVIQSAHGSGCFVKEGANDILRQEGTARLEELKLLVRELHLTGVTVEDMIACVREATQNDTSEGGTML